MDTQVLRLRENAYRDGGFSLFRLVNTRNLKPWGESPAGSLRIMSICSFESAQSLKVTIQPAPTQDSLPPDLQPHYEKLYPAADWSIIGEFVEGHGHGLEQVA